MYYDIHTHLKRYPSKSMLYIYNLNVADYICCSDLDLQNLNHSLGIHPWYTREEKLSENLDFIKKNVSLNCVKAIGECGLDKQCTTPWNLQINTFIAQIEISEYIRKPLIIHCVKAFDELIALKKELKPTQAWIIHGFRGKPQQMQQLIKQDLFLSFGLHFNADTLKKIPLESIFLETDDANCSIENIYEKVASTLQLAESELIQIIEGNIKRAGFNC